MVWKKNSSGGSHPRDTEGVSSSSRLRFPVPFSVNVNSGVSHLGIGQIHPKPIIALLKNEANRKVAPLQPATQQQTPRQQSASCRYSTRTTLPPPSFLVKDSQHGLSLLNNLHPPPLDNQDIKAASRRCDRVGVITQQFFQPQVSRCIIPSHSPAPHRSTTTHPQIPMGL